VKAGSIVQDNLATGHVRDGPAEDEHGAQNLRLLCQMQRDRGWIYDRILTDQESPCQAWTQVGFQLGKFAARNQAAGDIALRQPIAFARSLGKFLFVGGEPQSSRRFILGSGRQGGAKLLPQPL